MKHFLANRVFLLAALVGAFCLIPPASYALAQGGTDQAQVIFLPLVINQFDGRWQWEGIAPVPLEPTPNSNTPLLAALDSNGRLHVLWDTLSAKRFLYHTLKTQTGWTAPAPIAQTLGSSYTLFPPMIDTGGTLHLVWRNELGVGQENPYRLMYAAFDGGSWSDESEVYRTQTYGVQGMVHPDDSGGLRITFIDSNGISTRAYQTIKSQAGWAAPVLIDPTQPVSLVWPDRTGGVRFYADQYPDQMLYTYWKDGQFQVDGQVLQGKVSGHPTLLDGQGNLHAYWTGQVPIPGGSVMGVSHQCLDQALTWSEPKTLSGQTAISGSVKAAVDGNSRFLLGWIEPGQKALRLTFFNGCREVGATAFVLPSNADWELSSLAIGAVPARACALLRKQFTFEYSSACVNFNVE